jgi:hypothetical protein
MEISEQELRSMIRDAIARQQGRERPEPTGSAVPVLEFRLHASHGLLPVLPTGDGECIIEPTVRCDHCGYCKSLGH